MEKVRDYLMAHRQALVDDLFELLRIPSVSAEQAYAADVRRAATWLRDRFAAGGLPAELIPTCGNPLVFAQTPPVPGKPVALVYGHYDVQPPDPLDEWTTGPFEPTVRDGNVYARGATDDKGQVLTHVASALAWLKTQGSLPLQVKFLIEGEEEVGSSGLYEFLQTSADRLACDTVVISDTSQYGRGQPAITYGLKGIAYFELKLTGPQQDLHSGSFGGAVQNPANVLCRLLASLQGLDGRVLIPSFYDDVEPISDAERQQFAALPYDEAAFCAQLGVEAVAGEAGYTTLERRWARPTFDINGLTSGYQGEGTKTVLPARASAKFSCRLVPRQQPQEVARHLKAYLAAQIPPGIRWELVVHHGAPGFVLPLDSPYIQAASRAITAGFGTPPVLIREGGSIPIVTEFAQRLHASPLLLGWGQDDDNMHSPNEKFSLDDYLRGTLASAQLWTELAKIDR